MAPDEARDDPPRVIEPPGRLEHGGEAAALVRAIDWSTTPLGPIASWPESLKTTVGILLHSRHPMFLWWGPELIQIYNDANAPSFGKGKHPRPWGNGGRSRGRRLRDLLPDRMLAAHPEPFVGDPDALPIPTATPSLAR